VDTTAFVGTNNSAGPIDQLDMVAEATGDSVRHLASGYRQSAAVVWLVAVDGLAAWLAEPW